MQLDRKTLAFLQLPATKGDLYVPTSGSKGLVHTLIFHNTNTTAESVVLNYHDGTSEHEVFSQSIAAGDTLTWTFKGAGDVVEDGGKYTGNTTTASKVTLKVCGTEETAGNSAEFVVGERSNLWVPPSTAHAYDDEFESDTLSGWTGVRNVTDGVDGSFSYGAIDAYDTSFNSGNVVRVNANDAVRPSWALIQAPGSYKGFSIYKAITMPTNVLVWARFKFNNRQTIVADDTSCALELVDSVGGVPTLNGKTVVYLNESDPGTIQVQSMTISSGGSASGIVNSTNVNVQGQALEYVAIHKIGSTFHTWTGTSSGNWIWMNSYSGLDYTPDMVAIHVGNSSVSAPGAAVVGVDFVRFVETDNFLL